jgi:hypothetical protein
MLLKNGTLPRHGVSSPHSKEIPMNPEMVSPDYTDETENPKLLEPSNGDTKLLLPQQLSTDSPNAQWQQYGERIATFLRDLPTTLCAFLKKTKDLWGASV